MISVYILTYNNTTGQGISYSKRVYPEIRVVHYGTNEGLSQGKIKGITIDKRGYLWVGTKDGLNRYDGKEFITYRHDSKDSNTISGNYLWRVYADSKNRLWVSSEYGKIDMIDLSTGIIRHIHKGFDISNNENKYYTYAIKEDIFGNIYIAGKHGKCFIVESKTGFQLQSAATTYPFLKDYINDNKRAIHEQYFLFPNDSTIALKKSDSLYILTKEDIVTGNKPQAFNIKGYFIFGYNRGSMHNGSSAILRYKNGVIERYNQNKKVFDFTIQLRDKADIGRSVIDTCHNLWYLTTDNQFIIRVGLTTKLVDTFSLNWQDVNNNARYDSDYLFIDNNQNIWITTSGYGLYKLNTKHVLFKPFPTIISESRKKINQYPIRYDLPGKPKSYDHQAAKEWEKYLQYLPDKGLFRGQRLVYDKNGYFWLSKNIKNTEKNYLIKIKPDSSRNWIEVMKTPFHGYIYIDNENNIWVSGTNKNNQPGLLCYEQKEKKITEYAFPNYVPYSPYNTVSDLYQANDGKIWFATTSGVYALKPEQKKWTYFKATNRGKSLSSNIVLSVCPDPVKPDSFLWLGTDNGGLNKFNKKTKEFTCYNTQTGLPNNVIYSILSDNHDNLWLGTNNGLCLFDPQTGRSLRTFTYKNGLPSNEFNRYYYSKDENNNLYLSTAGGYITFNPDDYYKNLTPSNIVINNLKVLGENVSYYNPTQNYELLKPIESCRELVFDHHQNMFTVGFALFDFSIPEENVYKYKLEGFNDDWIYAGTQREATFTNLSPGTYTFKVVGRNSNYVWSNEPATIQITILAPWWSTWWFRLCMILVVIGVLYSLYRLRTNQLLKVERMRNDIAQDLHDEIGSTLSSISLYATVMQKTSDELSKKSGTLLNKIEQNTSEMMEAMNDIVWATKTDNDNLEQVVDRMRAFSAITAEAKGITLEFNVERKAERVKVSMQQRKNIYMMFKEAVNNAIKHSNCNKVIVTVLFTAKKLQISIQDNGIGFDIEEMHKNNNSLSGNGLDGIERRAQQIGAICSINSTRGIGTVISITLALK